MEISSDWICIWAASIVEHSLATSAMVRQNTTKQIWLYYIECSMRFGSRLSTPIYRILAHTSSQTTHTIVRQKFVTRQIATQPTLNKIIIVHMIWCGTYAFTVRTYCRYINYERKMCILQMVARTFPLQFRIFKFTFYVCLQSRITVELFC